MSAASLSIMTLACIVWGDDEDVKPPIVFLVAYGGPYLAAAGDLPDSLLPLIILHSALALVFYESGGQKYGNAIGTSFVVAAMLGLASLTGILSHEVGRGVSMTYWHLLACLNHIQNAIVFGAVCRHMFGTR